MEIERYECEHTIGTMCGNSIDIKIPTRDIAEIRADVMIEDSFEERCCNIVRVWGQVVDSHQCPIPYALLKLVKVINTPEGKKYKGIAHGISDGSGFYQFDVYYCEGNEYYKIIVSRMYTGPEQIQIPCCKKNECQKPEVPCDNRCCGEEKKHKGSCGCKPPIKPSLTPNCEYVVDSSYSVNR